MEKIRVISYYFKSYDSNRQEIKAIIKKELIDSFAKDAVLIETPIGEEGYWTDIFMISPETIKDAKEVLAKNEIQCLSLMSEKFLGRISKKLICLNTLSRAREIERIIA